MARKSIAQLDPAVTEALENFERLSAVKYELARDVYEAQDESTRLVLDRIQAQLRLHATGYINVQLDPPRGKIVPLKVQPQWVDYNLLYIAVEILSDLALFDIKVANFIFPATLCAQCKATIIPERHILKGGR